MNCKRCGSDLSKVLDSRHTPDSIRRRRQCEVCGARWTTYEVMEDTPVLVVKKNGAREPYDIAKLSDRIMRACAKRPVSLEQAEEIATDICAEFKNLMLREVPSELIGEKTLKRLKQLDIVAYIRFASVYGEFENADEFVKVISEI